MNARIGFLVAMAGSFVLLQVTGQIFFFYLSLAIAFALIVFFGWEKRRKK